MKVLALDFDGVIADSQIECLLVGFNTYMNFTKDTKLFDGQKITYDNFDELKEKYKETIEKYKKLRPYVIDAFCYYVFLRIIENNIEIRNQNEYIELREKLMKDYYKEYVTNYYEERSSLQEQDYEKWVELEAPFENIINDIKKLENNHTITIATNNKKNVVKRFLDKFNINPKIITDPTISIDKEKQLSFIKNKLNVNFEDIHFVDDQVKHFPKLLKLGVKCYLATWGYNNEQQQEEAKELGVVMLTKDNFYKELENSS